MQTPDIRPRTVSDIIDVVFRIFIDAFAPLVTITAVVTGPILFVQGLVQLAAFNDLTERDLTNVDSIGDLVSGEQITASLVLGILGWIASALASGAVVRAVADVHLGRPVDWQASVRQGMGFLAPLVVGSLLFGIGVSVGLIFLVVPGIFLALSWAMFAPAIVIERRGGTDALSRSWQLVSGRRWQTLGAFVVILLLTSIVGALLGRVLSFGADFTFIDVVVSTAIGVVLAPLTATSAVVIYLELRARKEGYDAVALDLDIAAGPAASGGSDPLIR